MKVTIITASLNNATTIEETILSVLNQSYKNIEYIVIDALSTDQTHLILEKYQSRISLLVKESDNGIYQALNKGINLATGNIIGFLHADDVFAHPQVIENIVKKFTTHNCDSVYSDLQYVATNNVNKIIRYWKAGKYSAQKLQWGWMPPHPTFYVKKEIYHKYGGFNETFKIAADYDLMLRFLGKFSVSVCYIPDVHIKMRIGGKSNKSLKNIILKIKEDVMALKNNKIGNKSTIFFKTFRKIPQFFIRKL